MKYVVKNLAGKSIEMDWTIDLLPEDVYNDWITYTKTSEYTKEIKDQKRIIADMVNDFVTDRRLGELGYGYSNDAITGNQKRFPQYKFILKKDQIILVDARVVGRFRSLERYPIVQKDSRGNDTDQVHYEGLLEIEEVPDDYELDAVDIKDDSSVDLYIGKTYFELRKIASTRGLKPKPGLKMPELLELLKKDTTK